MKVRIQVYDRAEVSWLEFDTSQVVVEEGDAGVVVSYDDEYTGGFALVPFTAPDNDKWQVIYNRNDKSLAPIRRVSYKEALDLSKSKE